MIDGFFNQQSTIINPKAMEDIKTAVRQFIIENFLFEEDDNLKDDSSFLEDGIIDSTGVLEMVTFLEETYEIHIEDEEMIPENLDSLEAIGQYITRKKNGSG